MGNPSPVATWSKDGRSLVGAAVDRRVQITRYNLFIGEVRRTDGGVYGCTIRNIVGHESYVIRVVIEGNRTA